YDWSRAVDRETAARAVRDRIEQSFDTTVALQTTPGLTNVKQGFFLVYINSFNEWHEGHQFEPMRNWSEMTDADAAVGYQNAEKGRYRLDALGALVRDVIG